jgi:hypothetical protein
MPFGQPKGAAFIVEKIKQIPRRSGPHEDPGFDSIDVVMVYCRNDGSDITVVRHSPAPPPSDDIYYDRMIRRLGPNLRLVPAHPRMAVSLAAGLVIRYGKSTKTANS